MRGKAGLGHLQLKALEVLAAGPKSTAEIGAVLGLEPPRCWVVMRTLVARDLVVANKQVLGGGRVQWSASTPEGGR